MPSTHVENPTYVFVSNGFDISSAHTFAVLQTPVSLLA